LPANFSAAVNFIQIGNKVTSYNARAHVIYISECKSYFQTLNIMQDVSVYLFVCGLFNVESTPQVGLGTTILVLEQLKTVLVSDPDATVIGALNNRMTNQY
jgi:hypothetical protein